MKIPRFLIILIPLALFFAACDGFGTPSLDIQTFNLENRTGYEAAALIEPYVFADREQNPGLMSATIDAITVRETRDNLEKIGRVLEDFDQPIPGVRLHFQLIEADSFQEEDPSIASVVQELRSLFRYEGYRLIGEAMVPVAGGSQETQSFSQQFLGVENPIEVEARARVLQSGVVRLEPIVLSDTWNELMETTVNVTPGQTIVIGGTQVRTQPPGSSSDGGRSVVILTVRAEAG